ncbi:MAG: NUDIX hydrolase [Dehalococcoidia bacterium]|nr:NUDIX hydrolase [Dehalococcoidia bacterium]
MSPAVVVVIFTIQHDALSVLLIERAANPGAGQWALPGGILNPGETLEEAAVRKLEGETGVRDVYLEQLFTFDPIENTGAGVIVSYFALVDANRARLRPDLEWRPAWRPVRGLGELAFGNELIVGVALERLRNKLDYTNVAYSLLPAEFTLTELQRVYEAILGETMDKRNFRRRVVGLGVVKESGGWRKTGAHRPARLYEFTSRAPVTLG